MSTLNVKLTHGLKLGDKAFTDAVLRAPTSGDTIDAGEESEKLVATPEGFMFVQSPTLVGAHLLRRQVVRIGEITGPLTLGQLKMLDPGDFVLLQDAAAKLDAAAAETASREVAQRGRGDASAPRD